MSASFFYEGITKPDDSWRQAAGSATFIIGGLALVVTLRAVLKGVGEPAELARDPFTIRAAAEEYSADPRRAPLDPSFLEKRMDDWAEHISARSMNLEVEKKSDRLDRALADAAEQREFWRSVAASLHVYFVALLRFPFRFVWPLLGFVPLTVGTIWFVVGEAGLDVSSSWRPFAAVAMFVASSAAVTLFYCATRGNRARLWHRINLVAVYDARKALGAARSAQIAIATEDTVFRRVIERADAFLEEEKAARARQGRSFTLGRFHVAITSTTRKRSRKSQE